MSFPQKSAQESAILVHKLILISMYPDMQCTGTWIYRARALCNVIVVFLKNTEIKVFSTDYQPSQGSPNPTIAYPGTYE